MSISQMSLPEAQEVKRGVRAPWNFHALQSTLYSPLPHRAFSGLISMDQNPEKSPRPFTVEQGAVNTEAKGEASCPVEGPRLDPAV